MSTIGGVAVGIVSATKDPAGRGRVRVRVPSVPEAEEAWAPVVAIGAGTARTRYQSGDQVLVAFEHGDPRRPYVIGRLWSGQEEPPAP